jgi:hypothetical protein
MRIITLLSDFGKNSLHTGQLKGGLMSFYSGRPVQIIDLCHCIEPDNYLRGAYLAAAAGRNFPEGTIHLLMAGLNMAGSLLACVSNGQYYIGPDNGLTGLLPEHGNVTYRLCQRYNAPQPPARWLPAFLAAIQLIEQGKLNELPEVAPGHQPFEGALCGRGELIRVKTGNLQRLKQAEKSLQCDILYVDRFKNIVLHLSKERFYSEKGQLQFQIKIPGLPPVGIISEYYGAVSPGQPLCRFNSLGYLEISVNARHDDAGDRQLQDTGLIVLNNLNSDRVIDFSTVTINFYED